MIEVVRGSALDFRAAPGEFACVITDPPYAAHVHDNATSLGVGGRGSRPRDLGFASLSDALRERIVGYVHAVSRWSVVFSDLETAYLWIDHVERLRRSTRGAEGARYMRWINWVRWAQPQQSGDRPPSGAEAVLTFHAPGKAHWNGSGGLSAYTWRAMRGLHKHPTQKPLDLALDLVSAFSDPGDLVLDPCAGAGTIALACRLLDRSCLALEIDPAWARYAAARAAPGAVLEARDVERAAEWVTVTHAEAERVPAPRAADGSDLRTWRRAQRRLADVARVAERLA